MLARNTPKLLENRPERLVVTGFRCCMAGYELGDIQCWEQAWRCYDDEIGPQNSRRLMGELQHWVRAVRSEAQKSIQCFPLGCNHVCADECMALALIASLQLENLDATWLATQLLTGSTERDRLERVAGAATGYADALLVAGLNLSSVPECVIESIARLSGEHGRLVH